MSTPSIEYLNATDIDVSVEAGLEPGSLVLLLSTAASVTVCGTRRDLRELIEDVRTALDDPALTHR